MESNPGTTLDATLDPARRGAQRGFDAIDPWFYLEEALEQGPAMAWRSPGGGLSFVAWGADDGVAADGHDALSQVSAWYATACEQRSASHDGPVFVGGFPFSGHGAGEPSPWHAARLWKPTHLAVNGVYHGPGSLGAQPRPRPTGSSRVPTHEAVAVANGYSDRVHDAVNAIRRGGLDKVVLARAVDVVAPSGTLSPSETARAMASAFPRATVFAIAMPGGEVLCGATPELMASVQNGALSTQAVAGTGRGAELLHSEKDRHEHELVVRDIVQVLAQHDVVVRHDPMPELHRSGDLFHLVTPIRGLLPAGMGIVDVVHVLHPTAALAGTPRDDAKRWIAEREGLDRGWYGGPIGWADDRGNGTFAVALRCALFAESRDRARCFAGAGIVANSVPQLEEAETTAKMQAAIRCLRGVV